ncbi:MAG: TetR/AcrR family transcriptional regulator [Sediminibacterium sp.]|nr:TetR/AcrR family transcriptional regulator [Sediminibacterium sp.]
MSDQKKQDIIQAAIQLFAEKGYEGTSIRDLAKRAQVNVAMVNYYFGSKEKLFEALVASRASYIRDLLVEMKKNTRMSAFEKMELIIQQYVTRILDNRAFFQVMQQEMLVTIRPELNRNITDVLLKNIDAIVKIIQTGIRNKEFRKVDPQLTFASIIGTLQQVLMSRSLCNRMLGLPENDDPYAHPHFKKRLHNHIHQMMHAHLLAHQH